MSTVVAFPDLPLIRVHMLTARCHDCKGWVTVWRTAVGLITCDRRMGTDPIMERHQCPDPGFLVDL